MRTSLFRAAILLVILGNAEGETLKLATYNVENYGIFDRMTESGFRSAYPKPEAEKRALRVVIRALDADVLALQEIGSRSALDELRRDLSADGLDYPHSAFLEAADPERHVALLSKRPFRAVRPHADIAFAFHGETVRVKRGLLEVVLGASSGDITVFALHLKSKLTERDDDPEGVLRREAEASAVRGCIRRRFPDPASGRYVILGDCNDGAHSAALRRLERSGDTVFLLEVPAADSRGETWTEAYGRGDSYSQLDHILVSPALARTVRGSAARICDVPETMAASDHRPVCAVLELGPAIP